MAAYPPRATAPILIGKALLLVVLLGVAARLGPLGLARLQTRPDHAADLIDVIKVGMNVWHAILARIDLIAPAVLLSVLPPALALRFGGPHGAWMAAFTAPLPLLILPLSSPRFGLAGLLIIGLGGGICAALARRPALALLPGPGLLVPGASLAVFGPIGAKIAYLTVFPWAIACSALADIATHPRIFDPRAEDPAAWPARLLDPRVQELDRAPPGLACEFHDLDLVQTTDGSRWAVVVAEGSGRLLAYPRGAGGPGEGPRSIIRVAKNWGPMIGVVLDSELDPETGEVWHLNGAQRVTRRRLGARGWGVAFDLPLALPEDHAFTFMLPEHIALVHVNASTDSRESWLTLIGRAQPHPIRRQPLTDASGEPLRPPRHVVDLPTLGKLGMTSDFSDGLWIVEPSTGVAERQIDVPVANGAPLWSPALDRLLLPDPNTGKVRLLDPVSGLITGHFSVDRGVRTVAYDAGRGLLVSASVLTGRVRIDRITEGHKNELVDHFDGVMPMVRELALDEETGEAFLTTWGVVYRFIYASP